jgi:hypothetical protein
MVNAAWGVHPGQVIPQPRPDPFRHTRHAIVQPMGTGVESEAVHLKGAGVAPELWARLEQLIRKPKTVCFRSSREAGNTSSQYGEHGIKRLSRAGAVPRC